MSESFFLLTENARMLVERGDEFLGCVLLDYTNPYHACEPHKDVPFNKGEIISHPVHGFSMQTLHKTSHGPDIRSDGVFGVKARIDKTQTVTFATELLEIRRIKQYPTVLKEVAALPSAKKNIKSWILKSILRPPPVCLVVATLSCTRGTIERIERNQRIIHAKGVIPIATALAAGAGIPIQLPIGDITVGGHASRGTEVSTKSRIDEQLVIGLQLKIIRKATFEDDLRVRRKGPTFNDGRQLAGSDDEGSDEDAYEDHFAEDSDEGEFDDEDTAGADSGEAVKHKEALDLDIGGSPWRIEN